MKEVNLHKKNPRHFRLKFDPNVCSAEVKWLTKKLNSLKKWTDKQRLQLQRLHCFKGLTVPKHKKKKKCVYGQKKVWKVELKYKRPAGVEKSQEKFSLLSQNRIKWVLFPASLNRES